MFGLRGCSGFIGGGIWSGMGIGMIFMGAVYILALVFLAVIIFKGAKKKQTDNNNFALEILNKRFATGEISEEEYIKRKEILSKQL